MAGVALSTRQTYVRIARGFITACFGAQIPDWPSLTAAMITTFVSQEATMRRGAGRKLPAVAVQSFLRFLVFRGEIQPGMEAAAPLPPQWKQSSLPSRLGPEEIERVLAVYQEGTASGLRDRAILYLLARLGLRAQDVVLMCLDDIDWVDGRLALRPGKTRRERSLPLPECPLYQGEFSPRLHQGCLPEVKDLIIDMSLNASGVRNTARSLHISTNTVLSELKNF